MIGSPPGPQHLLVDGLHQRLGGRGGLDHADVALAARASSSGRGSGRALPRAGPSCRALRLFEQPAVQAPVVGRARGGRPRPGCCPGARRPGGRRPRRAPRRPSPVLLDPRRADEHRAQRPAAGQRRGRPRSCELAAEGVAARGHVEQPEVLAVEHDQPGAGAEHGPAGAHEARAAARPAPRARSRASSWWTRRRGSPAPSSPSRSAGASAPRAAAAPSSLEGLGVRLEVALEREHADRHAPAAPPGWRSPAALLQQAAVGLERADLDAGHRLAQLARRGGTRSGSSKCVVASTMARARRSGSADLKMPEPTKLPSAPSCIISAASAGVAMPPAQNSTTGSRPASATSRTSSSGACSSLAALGQLLALERRRGAGSRR